MKKFETSIGKYNIYFMFWSKKYGKSFRFNLFPVIEFHFAKHKSNHNFSICLGLFFYFMCIEFDNFDD